MPTTLLSTQVPIPQVVSGQMYLADYDFSAGLPAYKSARGIAAGDIVWANDFNRNAAYLDILAQYGAGLIGIATGLTLSAGSGLVVNVAAGGALIGGVLQNYSATTVVASSSSTNFIWFKQDGTFEVKTTTTAPTVLAALIGIALTAGTTTTAFDTSGVCYVRNNIAYRELADVDYPADTPPTAWIGITKTSGGMFLWTGSEYKSLGQDKLTVSAKTANYTLVDADRNKLFTNEGATAAVSFFIPTAVAGKGPFKFYVQAAQTVNIISASGDTIRIGASASTTPGTLASATVGNAIELAAINATENIALNQIGTWTVT